MNGEIPLDQVYGKRLEMIRPPKDRVEQLGAEYVRSLVDGAKETIAALQDNGVIVHLVTGGIEQAILPLANALNALVTFLTDSRRRLEVISVESDYHCEHQSVDQQRCHRLRHLRVLPG